MTHPDVYALLRRLDTLTRAAHSIRTHLPDLYLLGWERENHRDPLEERVSGDGDQPRHDRSPQPGNPSARHLYDQIAATTTRIETDLVGYERTMKALFFAGSSSPEPSRGSLISRTEHDRLLASQRTRRAAGDYTPAPLVDQPQHPGRRP